MNKRHRHRKENKRIALDLYKAKWNLDDYRIYISKAVKRYGHSLQLYIVGKNYEDDYWTRSMEEITSLKSLLKTIRATKKIMVWENRTEKMVFESLEEFKRYMLIKKIANI